MTGEATVRVEGLANLRRTLAAARREVADMTATQKRVGDLVRGRAAPPVESGRLRASLVVSAVDSESVTVSGTAIYAGRTEYGWPAVGQTARPFLMPAGRATEPTWTDYYGKTIQAALDDVRGA